MCAWCDPVVDMEWFPALFDNSLVFNSPPKGGEKKGELCDALTGREVPNKWRTT